ncbi:MULTISPECIES: glycosyltransferase family 2 protein [unclassified Aeromonas]|uniref:glycosyltransferase family 2 protein n=1 Tax=unclassified Aeromonas TaxID=257493 RepID=UPI0022DEB47C|nr:MULTISPECIES: glycosyltransferase family 2 protein [unclassified Aeromonas]
MNAPLVSIITATFNSQDYILETYESIRNQTLCNWEWLVTDDCSTDKTYEILLKLSANDCRIKVFRNETNSGAAASRNLSVSKASGIYIAYIDSDDLWLGDKLKVQLSFMKEDIDFSFTAYELIDKNGLPLNKIIDKQEQYIFDYKGLLKKNATLGCSTVLLRREAFPDLSMPLIRTGQDYATWLKLLKNGTKAYLLPIPLTKYRITPGSISRNKLRKALRQWQIYRGIEKIPTAIAFYYFVHYAWHAVFRR